MALQGKQIDVLHWHHIALTPNVLCGVVFARWKVQSDCRDSQLNDLCDIIHSSYYSPSTKNNFSILPHIKFYKVLQQKNGRTRENRQPKTICTSRKKSNEQGGNICDTVIYSAQQALSKPRMQQQKSNERSQKAVVNGYCAMCMVLSILWVPERI